MKAPARLGLYGAALVAVFTVAFITAGAVVPEHVVQNWIEDTAPGEHETNGSEEGAGDDH